MSGINNRITTAMDDIRTDALCRVRRCSKTTILAGGRHGEHDDQQTAESRPEGLRACQKKDETSMSKYMNRPWYRLGHMTGIPNKVPWYRASKAYAITPTTATASS